MWNKFMIQLWYASRRIMKKNKKRGGFFRLHLR